MSKRTQNFVDSPVQGALLKRVFLHWCGFFLVLAVAVITMEVLLGNPQENFAERFWREVASFKLIAVVMLSLLPAFMLDTIRFSNRFVGPVSRLRRALRDLKEGRADRLQFRDSDFWVEMGREFNALAELVESQRQEIARLQGQRDSVGV
jgi:nitrate/nitrite-specific signal transduction histidine kinase